MTTRLLHFLLVAAVVQMRAVAGEPLAKGIQDNSLFHRKRLRDYAQLHSGMADLQPKPPIFLHHSVYVYEQRERSGRYSIELPIAGLMEEERVPAFAPRFTLVLPTGNKQKGFGDGRVGYETNLPFSKGRW